MHQMPGPNRDPSPGKSGTLLTAKVRIFHPLPHGERRNSKQPHLAALALGLIPADPDIRELLIGQLRKRNARAIENEGPTECGKDFRDAGAECHGRDRDPF